MTDLLRLIHIRGTLVAPDILAGRPVGLDDLACFVLANLMGIQ